MEIATSAATPRMLMTMRRERLDFGSRTGQSVFVAPEETRRAHESSRRASLFRQQIRVKLSTHSAGDWNVLRFYTGREL